MYPYCLFGDWSCSWSSNCVNGNSNCFEYRFSHGIKKKRDEQLLRPYNSQHWCTMEDQQQSVGKRDPVRI